MRLRFSPRQRKFHHMDGSSFDAGLFSNNVNLLGGTTYLLSFDLGGTPSWNQKRHRKSVTFGSTNATYILNSTDSFSTYSLSFHSRHRRRL